MKPELFSVHPANPRVRSLGMVKHGAHAAGAGFAQMLDAAAPASAAGLASTNADPATMKTPTVPSLSVPSSSQLALPAAHRPALPGRPEHAALPAHALRDARARAAADAMRREADGFDIDAPTTGSTLKSLALVLGDMRDAVDSASARAAMARKDAVTTSMMALSSSAAGPAGAQVGDSLWRERFSVDDLTQKFEDDKKPTFDAGSSTGTLSSLSFALPTAPGASPTHVDAVREVPPGPLRVTTEQLMALLPEGGRVLHATPEQVRLELPHALGPMLLDISLNNGAVDVRARGGASAELSRRVPELAAAMQSAGIRLGSFDVRPARDAGATSDDTRSGQRQNSDDRAERIQRIASRRTVNAVVR